jgi:kynurenine formamidase
MPTWPQFQGIEITPITTHARDGKSTFMVKTNMHSGTHIDAPSHYCETGRDLGKLTLDELVSTGIVIDLSPIAKKWSLFSLDQVLRAAPEPIRERDIVIFHTGWHKYSWVEETYDEVTFFDRHPGFEPQVINYLVDKKVKWFGVDTPSIDHSLQTRIRGMRPDLVREYEEMTGAPIEETLPMRNYEYAHYKTARNDVSAVEILSKETTQVLGRRMTLGAFPWRWLGGEGCLCRVVAFLDE